MPVHVNTILLVKVKTQLGLIIALLADLEYCHFGHFSIIPQIATYFATNFYLFCQHNACCQQVPIMPVIMPAD